MLWSDDSSKRYGAWNDGTLSSVAKKESGVPSWPVCAFILRASRFRDGGDQEVLADQIRQWDNSFFYYVSVVIWRLGAGRIA